ncbi:MAG: hypothetical protein EAZ92_15125 [Candidatus Kapaibacterium sp.]|nr:MAG: hypothetical protein EAZ92_15125 [Candidatus Kapabacteria bacterium]
MNTKTQKFVKETIVSEETALVNNDLVNTVTGEVLEHTHTSESELARFTPFQSAFSVPKQEGIIYTAGHPRQYRADCKAGQFKIGESTMKGREMPMEVISYRTFEAELFNYPRQAWLEMFFVDAENALSHILFKGISIENFITLYTDILIKRRSVGESITTGRLEKRTGREGDYYLVEFAWKDSTPARVQELVEFAEANALVNARFAQL